MFVRVNSLSNIVVFVWKMKECRQAIVATLLCCRKVNVAAVQPAATRHAANRNKKKSTPFKTSQQNWNYDKKSNPVRAAVLQKM